MTPLVRTASSVGSLLPPHRLLVAAAVLPAGVAASSTISRSLQNQSSRHDSRAVQVWWTAGAARCSARGEPAGSPRAREALARASFLQEHLPPVRASVPVDAGRRLREMRRGVVVSHLAPSSSPDKSPTP
ncbi:hypothetical protein ACP70R_005594 [Stipagrostis hirtigluma subsp. patula]